MSEADIMCSILVTKSDAQASSYAMGTILPRLGVSGHFCQAH